MYGGTLLPARQQAELMSLVSERTGQPIEQTSQDDPRGFGLGVEQLTGPTLGTVWLYEGATRPPSRFKTATFRDRESSSL